KCSLEQAPTNGRFGKADGRIKKKFDRVISRLAMDLHQPREIWRAIIVEPIVVGKPRVTVRDRDQLARTRMVQRASPLLSSVENPLYTGQAGHDPSYLRNQAAFLHVNMSNLMICDGESS